VGDNNFLAAPFFTLNHHRISRRAYGNNVFAGFNRPPEQLLVYSAAVNQIYLHRFSTALKNLHNLRRYLNIRSLYNLFTVNCHFQISSISVGPGDKDYRAAFFPGKHTAVVAGFRNRNIPFNGSVVFYSMIFFCLCRFNIYLNSLPFVYFQINFFIYKL